MIYASFQIKKKSLVVMFEIGYLALKTVIDSFHIYTIHSLIKKVFETNSIMSEDLFWVAQPKQNENTIILIKGSFESRKSCFQKNILF